MNLDLFAKALSIRFEKALKNPAFVGLVVTTLFLGSVGFCAALFWCLMEHPVATVALIGASALVGVVWGVWPRLQDIDDADKPEPEPRRAPKPAEPEPNVSHLPLKVGRSYKPRIQRYCKKVTIILIENNLALGSDGTNYDARTGRFHRGATAPAIEFDLVEEVFATSEQGAG